MSRTSGRVAPGRRGHGKRRQRIPSRAQGRRTASSLRQHVGRRAHARRSRLPALPQDVSGTASAETRRQKGRCIHSLCSWELSPGLGFEVRNGYQSAPALDVFELQDIAQAVDDDPVNAGGNVQIACWRGRAEGVYAAFSSNDIAGRLRKVVPCSSAHRWRPGLRRLRSRSVVARAGAVEMRRAGRRGVGGR